MSHFGSSDTALLDRVSQTAMASIPPLAAPPGAVHQRQIDGRVGQMTRLIWGICDEEDIKLMLARLVRDTARAVPCSDICK